MTKKILICSRHDKQVPLIWTFRFVGAEYWCPHCGANYGMLGDHTEVDETPELLKERSITIIIAAPFLAGETDKWEYKHE